MQTSNAVVVPTIEQVYEVAPAIVASILNKFRIPPSRLLPTDVISDMVNNWVRYGFVDQRGWLVGFDATRGTIGGWVRVCATRVILRHIRRGEDRTAAASRSLSDEVPGTDGLTLEETLTGDDAPGFMASLILSEVRARMADALGIQIDAGDAGEVVRIIEQLNRILRVDIIEIDVDKLRRFAAMSEQVTMGKKGNVAVPGGKRRPANMLTALHLAVGGMAIPEIAELFGVRPQTIHWRFSDIRAQWIAA